MCIGGVLQCCSAEDKRLTNKKFLHKRKRERMRREEERSGDGRREVRLVYNID